MASLTRGVVPVTEPESTDGFVGSAVGAGWTLPRRAVQRACGGRKLCRG